MKRICYVLVTCLLLVTPSRLLAVPPAAQPGQVQQRLNFEEALPEVNQKNIITAPEVSPPAPTKKNEIKFRLNGIRIQNATAFTAEELSSEYTEFIGKDVTPSTLRTIAFRITVRYRNAGYILSRAVVPPQQSANGIFTIRVVEGYVNKVTFEGNIISKNLLEKYADKIRSSRPLNIHTLERNLLLIQDLAGVTSRTVIHPSDVPEASDIHIILEEKHMEASVGIDNRNTRFMGPVEGTMKVDLNDLTGHYDHTQIFGVQTAETAQMHYGQIVHEEPLDADGTKLTLSVADTLNNPGYTLASADLAGHDILASASVSHPFIRSQVTNLYGNIQFDIHDSSLESSGIPIYDDQLRVLRAGLSYNVVDSFSGINTLGAALSQGVGWGASEDFNSSRVSGQTNFFKGNINASRLQSLTGPFQLYVAGSGQIAADTLLTEEEFSIGGGTFGTAYDPSEILGDNGADGRVELRYNNAVNTFPFLGRYQLYGFYDIGAVWSRDIIAGDPSRQSLADTGFGIRFFPTQSFSGSFEFAQPLTRAVAADGRSGYRPREFFALNYHF